MAQLKKKPKNSVKRYGVVVSQFNDFITEKLLDGCLDELSQHGVAKKNITVIRVPGSFEIPIVALHLAKKKNIDAVICLGAVIRGETPHFEYVASNTSSGIMQISLSTEKPVMLGVITADTVNQAYARSKSRGCNRGREAARAAVSTLDALKQIN